MLVSYEWRGKRTHTFRIFGICSACYCDFHVWLIKYSLFEYVIRFELHGTRLITRKLKQKQNNYRIPFSQQKRSPRGEWTLEDEYRIAFSSGAKTGNFRCIPCDTKFMLPLTLSPPKLHFESLRLYLISRRAENLTRRVRHDCKMCVLGPAISWTALSGNFE